MFGVVGWRQFGYKIAPMLEHQKGNDPAVDCQRTEPLFSLSLPTAGFQGFVVSSAFYACAAAFFLPSSRTSRFSKKADRRPFSTRRSNSSSKSDLTEKLMLMCLFRSGSVSGIDISCLNCTPMNGQLLLMLSLGFR